MDARFDTGRLLVIVNLAAALYMTGVIWFVQVVHYPLFDRVGKAGFAAYESAHTSLTTFVVAPVMLVELGAAVLFLFYRPIEVPSWAAWLGLLLVIGLWLSTFALQVPRHAVLSSGFDPQAYEGLVRSNWIRTVLWTTRSVLFLGLLAPIAARA